MSTHPISEDMSLISEAVSYDFEPIQKDGKLFKFILYTTKVEIKFNSLIRLIYNTSIFEMAMWVLGFLLFIASPKDMYLIWFLVVHIAKGAIGLILLNKMPKTYEILENVAKNPNFDESKIIELIEKEIKDFFIIKWGESKNKFFLYLVSTIACLVIDLIIFIAQVSAFGKDEWLLMQTCMLFTILVFIITDVIYFLWFFTLQFTFPAEIMNPIKKAIFGSIGDLSSLLKQKLKISRNSISNSNN
jgi:hypothetical protein